MTHQNSSVGLMSSCNVKFVVFLSIKHYSTAFLWTFDNSTLIKDTMHIFLMSFDTMNTLEQLSTNITRKHFTSVNSKVLSQTNCRSECFITFLTIVLKLFMRLLVFSQVTSCFKIFLTNIALVYSQVWVFMHCYLMFSNICSGD